jgi:hypothetical protein
MKFGISKRMMGCGHCDGVIMRGEHFVASFFKYKKKYPVSLTFHVGCYLEWYGQQFDLRYKQWWESIEPRPKMGRPKKYTDSKGVNRLKCLIRYHRSKGNEARVAELKAQLPPSS